VGKGTGVDGLGEVSRNTRGTSPCYILGHRVSGHAHDRQVSVRMIMPDPLREFDPIHVGQSYVHDHQIRPLLRDQLLRLPAVGGSRKPEPFQPKDDLEELIVEIVVFYDEEMVDTLGQCSNARTRFLVESMTHQYYIDSGISP